MINSNNPNPNPNPNPKENGLLNALPEENYLNLLSDLESVDLPLHRVIYEPGDKITHIYFPTSGCISKLYITGVTLYVPFLHDTERRASRGMRHLRYNPSRRLYAPQFHGDYEGGKESGHPGCAAQGEYPHELHQPHKH